MLRRALILISEHLINVAYKKTHSLTMRFKIIIRNIY